MYIMKTKSVLFRISEEEFQEAQDFISSIREAGNSVTLSEIIRNGIRREIAERDTDPQTAKKQMDAIALYDTVSRFFLE